jgi:hypothetical protein
MAFFDTYPNDSFPHPWRWPLTYGNIHQLLLYGAIGATLCGIGLRIFVLDRTRAANKIGALLFWLAVIATLVQAALVIAQPTATRFGGITERIIVVATLLWVIGFCASDKDHGRSA